MFTTVSTVSPVSQADVGLLFWRFSGGGGFSYDQLEASCCQVCFSAASSSPWMIEVVHMVSVTIWYTMIQPIFIIFSSIFILFSCLTIFTQAALKEERNAAAEHLLLRGLPAMLSVSLGFITFLRST